MRELVAFLVALTFAVLAFLVVGIVSCLLALGSRSVSDPIQLALILGVSAAIGAGYLGAKLVLNQWKQ
jgi:hypothetical protein